MKMFAMMAAGLAAVATLAPVSANAQHRVVVTRHTTVVRHSAHGRRHRQVCRTYWVHHHRVRRCHTVWY